MDSDTKLAELLSLLEGHADVAQCRKALQETGGDLDGALQLIFSGRLLGIETFGNGAASSAAAPAHRLVAKAKAHAKVGKASVARPRAKQPSREETKRRRLTRRLSTDSDSDVMGSSSLSTSSDSDSDSPSLPSRARKTRGGGKQETAWQNFPDSEDLVGLRNKSWARAILSRELPSLTLKAVNTSYSSRTVSCLGDVHVACARGLVLNAEGKVPEDRLAALFKDFLGCVRYPPGNLKLSYRKHERSSSGAPIPHDLTGTMRTRPPFQLQGTLEQSPAKQPPSFKSYPLRQEQLCSLAWMLSQEGCTKKQPAPFTVAWRQFFELSDFERASKKYGKLKEGSQVAIDSGVSNRKSVLLKNGHALGVKDFIQMTDKVCRHAKGQVKECNALKAVVSFDRETFKSYSKPTWRRLRTECFRLGTSDPFPNSIDLECWLSDLKLVGKEDHHNYLKQRAGGVAGLQAQVAAHNSGVTGVDLRAEATYNGRGGILGDKIGYGKTATTIGLIDTTAKRSVPPVPELDQRSFIKAQGTLIIVPSNLWEQWLLEISKFTWEEGKLKSSGLQKGWSPKGCPLRVFALSSVANLKSVTAGDLAKADIVLCSYRLLYSPIYLDRRRKLAGVEGRASVELARLVETTEELLAGEYDPQDWSDLQFPLLEMFYWRRVVFDEFHELESFDSEQQSILQHLRAHYRWGLTGTPPVGHNAGVIFMSSLFRIDLPGKLDLTSFNNPSMHVWEIDKILSESADKFVKHYIRQNSADLQHIRLEEHLVPVHHTAAERALYLGQAHDAPALDSAEAFGNAEKKQALKNLLCLCSHFQAGGGDTTSAKAECGRISEQKEKRAAKAKKQVDACCFVLELLKRKSAHIAPHLSRVTSNLEKITAEGGAGKLVKDFVSETMAEAIAMSLEDLIKSLACRSVAGELLVDQLLGVGGGSRRATASQSAWLNFFEAGLAADALSAIADEQVCQQDANLNELGSAMASEDFFRRAVSALVENAGSDSRTCSVCLEDNLELSRMAITPCAHSFCMDCLRLTVRQFKQCSICRRALKEDDIRPVALEADAAALEQSSSSSSSSSRVQSASSSSSSGAQSASSGQYSGYGAKLATLCDKLLQLRAEDSTAKVILFVQFEDLQRKTAKALQEFGLGVVQLQGNVSQRAKVIDEWQNNPSSEKFVLLLSLEQNASGTNLQAASHVVFLHPMLAATTEQAVAYEMQAIGRARRLGQKRDVVKLWRFVTMGTIEQTLTERHQAALWAREGAQSGSGG